MFEKEAEEYKDTYFGFADERISEVQDFEGNYIDISERIMKTFIDGAEFGYNKAKEWHYVKDKLPEEDVYVYLLCKKDDYPVVARRHIFYGETEWKWDCKWGSGFQLKADNEKIIAWKEIVLPKEIKEK